MLRNPETRHRRTDALALRPVLLCAAVIALACGTQEDAGVSGTRPTDGTGGAAAGGGSSGTTAGGGASTSGGNSASGGNSGTSASGGSGGTSASGGTSGPDGGSGTSASGGTSATGGNSGTSASGGSGGTSASGGSAGTGGASGAGGAPGGDLCDVGVWDGTTPEVLAISGSTFAHDPTMIEANGVFYRFWTGNRIPQARSTNLTSWQDAPAVYASYPSWSNDWLASIPGETFNFPWAPDVSFFSGQYHIYSSFSAIFGDNISCITHLTTNDIAAGNWTDHGPVICTRGNENYNAIDADVGVDTNGTPWLAFGSFWDGIMAFQLNADGSRAGNDMTRLAWARQIEAPVLFRRCGFYYLFVTWGLCCPGEGRSVDQLTYRIAVGRSQNIMGPYVDRSGTPMIDGGGTLLVEGDGVQWAAAGHSDVIATGDKIYHLYHAYRQSNGAAQLRIVELPFDEQGWPVPGGP